MIDKKEGKTEIEAAVKTLGLSAYLTLYLREMNTLFQNLSEFIKSLLN